MKKASSYQKRPFSFTVPAVRNAIYLGRHPLFAEILAGQIIVGIPFDDSRFLGGGCGQLSLIRHESDVAIVLQTGTRRNKTSHDDVLLQTTQVVDLSADRCFRQNTRRLLE